MLLTHKFLKAKFVQTQDNNCFKNQEKLTETINVEGLERFA